jgi:hypothetical protein
MVKTNVKSSVPKYFAKVSVLQPANSRVTSVLNVKADMDMPVAPADIERAVEFIFVNGCVAQVAEIAIRATHASKLITFHQVSTLIHVAGSLDQGDVNQIGCKQVYTVRERKIDTPERTGARLSGSTWKTCSR